MAVSGGSPRMPPRLLRDVVGCLLVLLLHACSSRRADSLAVHFNGLEPGVISYTNTSWDGFSSREGTTVEFWVKLWNPHERWSPLMLYASLSPLAHTGNTAELAIDVGIAAGFLGFQWNRGGKFAACIPCGFSIDPMVYYTSWSHLVATLDFTTGDAAYYVNGTLLRKVPGEKQEAIFRTVPRPGGHILVGMGLAPSSVAWDVNQLSSAAMDDMRIHNRVLSADEVKAGAWKHPHQLPKSYTDSLVLHWGFDDPNGDTELDLSGRGRDGIRGAVDNVPGGRVSYKDSLTPVSKPRPVMGPVREPGPFNISTFVLLGEESQLHSRGTGASGPIQLVSLPETGQLLLSGSAAAAVGQDVSGAELLYRAPEQWPGSEEAPVEFRYQTGGVLYSARIYLARPCAAPNRAVAATSWENVTLLLGGICGDGRHVDTEILGPPTMGTIRAFVPGKQMWPLNFPLLPGSIGEEPGSWPWVVDNPQGIVAYSDGEPEADARSYHVAIRYRWVSPYASSTPGTVNITIEVRQRPPTMGQTTFDRLPGDLLGIQLSSADREPSGRNNRYRIYRAPRFGTLHQDVYGAPGNALGGYSQQALPMLQQFPDRIPPYSPEHGPAFSSQLGLCQDCCRRQATCNPADCAAVGEMNFEQCNDDPSHFADRMLGRVPPNFPDGLNTVSRSKTWSPECPSCGHEWIVVGFPVPIYAEGVMIYEAENPGAVVKISFAETYEGNRTDWTEVWADPMPKALSNTARVFAPSMCTLVGKKTQWVRLDLMTNTSVGWNEIAGLMLFGYESGDLSNWVAHPEGRLFYKQAPGITLSGDVDEFFEVGATDCTGMESEAVKISIPAAEIVRDDTDVFFGPAQPVQAAVGAAAEFEVNIEEARSHLSEALGDEVDEDEFVVVVAPDDGCFHTAEATGALVDNPLNVAGASEPVNCARQLHAKGHSITLAQGPPWGVALHPAHRGVFGGRATVLATARNVTYQLKIVIGVVCPENSSIYECAEGAEACYDEDASLSYDRINRLCRAEEGSDPASKKLVPVLVSCIAVFCLLLVPMVLTCRSYLKKAESFSHRSGPPKQGENVTIVITDIQGSTTLWDTFPGQVVEDLRLHHDIMRALLAKFHGYEIATEGDSFKVAFRSPEDAIMWCINVQLELLAAPWSPALEDGGASLQSGKTDWADCLKRPAIPEHCRALIDVLPGRGGLLETSAKTRSCSPMYSPADASSTAFSTKWIREQEAVNTVAHCGTKLPLFRGLRVRMGVHTGIADSVMIHETTRRVIYGGKVAKLAKAVSDIPCGGQIIISGESMASINSVHKFMAEVATICKGWTSGASQGPDEPAALTIMHLGSHLLNTPGTNMSITKSVRSETTGSESTRAKVPSGCRPLLERAVSFTRVRRMTEDAAAWDNSVLTSELHLGKEVPEEVQAMQDKLARAHELLMVVPWPLRGRAMHYPTTSASQVSPAWHQAPDGSHVTILFSAISEWEELKEWICAAADKSLVEDALLKHNLLVRSLLALHDGYEMEGEDGTFVVAFGSVYSAVKFASQVQTALLGVEWDADLVENPLAGEQYSRSGQLIFRGLRVKMGMCTGKAANVGISARTGRVEYFGPLLNHAARVTSSGHGGQVLMHESSWEDLRSAHSTEMEEDHSVLFAMHGQHMLKGIRKGVELVEVIPGQLSERNFPKLKTPSRMSMRRIDTATPAARPAAQQFLMKFENSQDDTGNDVVEPIKAQDDFRGGQVPLTMSSSCDEGSATRLPGDRGRDEGHDGSLVMYIRD